MKDDELISIQLDVQFDHFADIMAKETLNYGGLRV
jgi:hypothetical protein